MPKIDTPEVKKPTDGERWVEIPDVDLFDQPHPNIQINNEKYGPGKHFVPNEVADTIEDRVRVYARQNVRLLQPKKDANAEHLMQRGFNERGSGGQHTTNF